MTEPTIGVAIITRNRIAQLKRLLPQLVKFDQVVVCDTGSKDGTERYIRGLGKPFEYVKFPWRDKPTKKNPDFGFSAARNASFKALRTTHALWLDTDDVIGQLKGKKPIIATPDQAYNVFKKLAAEAAPQTDCWYIKYVYSRDPDGNPNAVHIRERMVKLSAKWRWIWPVHENLVPPYERHPAEVTDLDVIHLAGDIVKSSAPRNLALLESWLKFMDENGGNEQDLSRCRLNISETLMSLERWKDAAEFTVSQFLKKHPHAFDLEKFHAWTIVAKAQLELGNFEAARAAALACIDVEPGLSDGFLLLAQVKLATNADPQDILLTMEHVGITEEPPSQLITNPMDYSFTLYCIISDCKYQLGQYTAALDFALKAQAVAPSDPRVEALRSKAAEAIRRQDAVNAAEALYQLLMDYDENEKAYKLYDVLPYVAQQTPEIIEQAKTAYQRVRHLFNRDDYIKLYNNNSGWAPAKEEWITNETPPGYDRYMYVLKRLKKALPHGGRILDVGCSDGFHSLLYAKNGYEVVGVDLDPRCVQLANERAVKFNLPAKFVYALFEDLEPTQTPDPFDKTKNWFEHFDAVVCSEVIEHVQDPALLLGSLGDCAKENAPVIITTPDEAFDKGDAPNSDPRGGGDEGMIGHVRVFTQETFEALMRSNSEFDIVESRFVEFVHSAYREHQGWQCAEIRRRPRANGPIIRIFCGDAVKFCPDNIDQGGVGGSETAVVKMAEAWSNMGCQVVVYAGINGIYDGVFYRTADHFDIKNKSDVFISWRIPGAFQHGRPNATTTILWTHDLYYPTRIPGYAENEIPMEWVDRMDYVMVLSQFHKDYLERAHPTLKGKTFLTRNGIDPHRFVGKDVKKVPHRYFFSSSYERGLEELLKEWPRIKAAIPDAELHVGYGIDTAEAVWKELGNTEKLNWLYKMLNLMDSLPGVVNHQRIGQEELADLQLSCEAWLYPHQPAYEGGHGGWLETYCITALEAQAARCKIVSRKNGALPETIKHAVWWDESTDIIDVLTHMENHWKPEWTEKNYRHAIKLTWESLAAEWAQELSDKATKEEKETIAVGH